MSAVKQVLKEHFATIEIRDFYENPQISGAYFIIQLRKMTETAGMAKSINRLYNFEIIYCFDPLSANLSEEIGSVESFFEDSFYVLPMTQGALRIQNKVSSLDEKEPKFHLNFELTQRISLMNQDVNLQNIQIEGVKK